MLICIYNSLVSFVICLVFYVDDFLVFIGSHWLNNKEDKFQKCHLINKIMKLGDSGGVGVKLSPYNWRSDCIFQGFSRFIGKRASDLSLMLSFNVKERSKFQWGHPCPQISGKLIFTVALINSKTSWQHKGSHSKNKNSFPFKNHLIIPQFSSNKINHSNFHHCTTKNRRPLDD